MAERICSRLNFLIDGLAKVVLLKRHLLLSSDVITLIIMFYGFRKGLFVIEWNPWVYKNKNESMHLFNILTQKSCKTSLRHLSANKRFIGCTTKCVAQQCTLPDRMRDALQLNKLNYPLNNRYNLIFSFGSDTNKIFATNPSLYQNGMNGIYDFEISTINAPYSDLSIFPSTYNKTDQLLYKLCKYKLYVLDFKVDGNINSINDNDEDWQWEILKYTQTFPFEYGGTICMVDNDRFIGFMENHTKKTKLFALNCQVSIPLSSMCLKKTQSVSIYHNKFHKIIVCGDNSIESYDINKDKWTVIAHHCFPTFSRLTNILYSPFDYNIICGAGYTSSRKASQAFAFEVDLRDSSVNTVSYKGNGKYSHNVAYVTL